MYVQIKHKVQCNVDSLGDSDENIITEGFLMAEHQNEYFSLIGKILVHCEFLNFNKHTVRPFKTINCNPKNEA